MFECSSNQPESHRKYLKHSESYQKCPDAENSYSSSYLGNHLRQRSTVSDPSLK
ncbi:12692_t:CDS:2 [Cetraspora pellucida]|uniref:12692_t:CDS:1 n=1 Tax=Cetraspora pellucida TaxID=1433469 RepID=A0A9N8YVE4_9GLOM|nr:12692_t:CDS:2 [Cetraspora pellucida]